MMTARNGTRTSTAHGECGSLIAEPHRQLTRQANGSILNSRTLPSGFTRAVTAIGAVLDLGPIEEISLAYEPRDLALPEWGWEFDRIVEREREAAVLHLERQRRTLGFRRAVA